MLGFFISLQLCLSARNFQPAIEFLDVDITDMQKVVSVFKEFQAQTVFICSNKVL